MYYANGMFEEAADCMFRNFKQWLTPKQVGDLRSAFARAGIEGLFRVRLDQLKAVTDEAGRN